MRLALCSFVLVCTFATSAFAQTSFRLIPPVDAPMSAGFVAPDGDYGPGHRGVDYPVPVGTPVRAGGGGTVTFAGMVAGLAAVTIDHGSGFETTYSGMSRVDVRPGQRVGEGEFLGESGTIHGSAGLHFGVKRDGDYVDPAGFLVAIDVSAAIHLAPLGWTPDRLGTLGSYVQPLETAGTSSRPCRPVTELQDPQRPPNDNVVVAVAGITSKTRGGISADIYEDGPEGLGYDEQKIYRFSYAGADGPRFHAPYARRDTYIDIRTAAARLRALMRRIGTEHPGSDVDLIAHSQGGIVARTYLARAARTNEGLPRVDHFVTFATPHRGAPGASQVEPLRDETKTGRHLLGAMKELSDRGWPVPDPTSAAVRQLAPGSDLMRSLAREDVSFGTRVLALGIPNDPVVPANHALFPGEQGRIVPWAGMNLGGHSAIVSSPTARGIAYSFLSDRAPTCTTAWDRAGIALGEVWSALEGSLARAYGAVETIVDIAGTA